MKKIIHIDADCFFAAVEMQENPDLTLQAVAVGGLPQNRGVIATCNYEARKFGVHSAMSSAEALRLCPHLHILPPKMSVYKEYSAAMRKVFYEFTDVVEPLSLDEAYLDVTKSSFMRGSATLIAKQIRYQVSHEIGLSVSAGVAPVKFLAKIASDWRKPNGIFVIPPENVNTFMPELPVGKLPGVGRVTNTKLARFGVYTCGDLQKCGLEQLVRLFGAFGPKLYQMSRGDDGRDVQVSSQRKSVSVEKTYAEDIVNLGMLFPKLNALLEDLESRLGRIRTADQASKAFVKLKFNDFSVTTMEAPLSRCAQGGQQDTFGRLLGAAWQRKQLPVRLLGVGVRLSSLAPHQLNLDLQGDM